MAANIKEKGIPEVEIAKFTSLSIRKQVGETERDTALLMWSTRKGYPRISVYTHPSIKNEKGGMDYSKIITAPFDYITLGILFSYLDAAIKTDGEYQQVIECLNVKYVDGVKTTKVYTQAKVMVGKDTNGIIYISAIEEGKTKIKFELLPTRWFKFYKTNSAEELTDKKVLSKSYALSYLECLRKLFADRMVTEVTSVIKLGNEETIAQANVPPKTTTVQEAPVQPKKSTDDILYNDDGIDF